jgi:hypothetical protein
MARPVPKTSILLPGRGKNWELGWLRTQDLPERFDRGSGRVHPRSAPSHEFSMMLFSLGWTVITIEEGDGCRLKIERDAIS